MGEVIRPQQFWDRYRAKHKAMRMAAWRMADKRAKDACELVLRPEAVEAVLEGLKRRLHENKPANGH
jgi:hypothetical protein